MSRNDVCVETSNGGSELALRELIRRFENTDLIDNVQFTISRPDDNRLDYNKKRVLWNQDLANDICGNWLKIPGNKDKFDAIVFNSWYQFHQFQSYCGFEYEDNMYVLRNAINPITVNENDKEGNVVKLIHAASPHKCLKLLWPCYKVLYNKWEDNIHLDVFSNFELYGPSFAQRNSDYNDIFEEMSNHPGVTYHNARPQSEVLEALKKSDITLYPSIFPETSCMSLLESMSAMSAVVCPKFGALVETVNDYGFTYRYSSDIHKHANIFVNTVDNVISFFRDERIKEQINKSLQMAKIRTDHFYSWDTRQEEWEKLLTNLNNE